MFVTAKGKALCTAALAALTLGGAALIGAAPASAGDFGWRIGFDHPGYGYHRPVSRFPHDDFHAPVRKRVMVKEVIEEDDDEEECRVIVKKRYNRFGEFVVKRVQVCD